MERLSPEIARIFLSKFNVKDRLSILDAVILGNRPRKELETWGLFCACMAWGRLDAKRNLLSSFYSKLPNSFTEFVINPSKEPLETIYETAPTKLLGLCLAIKDLLEEYGSIGNLVKNSENVGHAIFKLAYTLWKNLEQSTFHGERFNLPKVKYFMPPTKIWEKKDTSALKRYCMYFRWMVRDSEPDFGIWDFFDKRNLYHPVDTHVARILKRWGVLTDEEANWYNVEKVTKYFREVEPNDPTKFDYHLVTFGQKYCKKKPLCQNCPIKQKFQFNCNVE